MTVYDKPQPKSDALDHIRIAVALIPTEPLFSNIIEASQAITRQFQNFNIIDKNVFPPHACLHICTISKDKLPHFLKIINQLSNTTFPIFDPSILIKGSTGYISFQLNISPLIRSLHESVLSAALTVRGDDYQEDPARLARLSVADRLSFQKYGNRFIFDKFNLHISIAKVAQEHQDEAFEIAKTILSTPKATPAAAIQVCDIGMRSEKWIVLYSKKMQGKRH